MWTAREIGFFETNPFEQRAHYLNLATLGAVRGARKREFLVRHAVTFDDAILEERHCLKGLGRRAR